MAEAAQLSFEACRLVDEISKRGYAEFDHDIDPGLIDDLIDRYTDFTLAHRDPEYQTMDDMLPSSNDSIDKKLDDLDRSRDLEKRWHKYRTNSAGVGKPDGYTNRDFQTKSLEVVRGIRLDDDPKEYYHYTPRHHTSMVQNHQVYEWGTIPPEVITLGRAFAPIHKRAANLLLKVASLVEETHPEVRALFTPDSITTSPLRLLFYHPDDSPQLGSGHYDKSSVTFQIAESHEGLRVAPNKESELQPVVRNSDKAICFAGRNLAEQVNGETPYRPGWHDIIKVDRFNQGRSVPEEAHTVCARWALIFFANGANYVNPDKTQTHVR